MAHQGLIREEQQQHQGNCLDGLALRMLAEGREAGVAFGRPHAEQHSPLEATAHDTASRR